MRSNFGCGQRCIASDHYLMRTRYVRSISFKTDLFSIEKKFSISFHFYLFWIHDQPTKTPYTWAVCIPQSDNLMLVTMIRAMCPSGLGWSSLILINNFTQCMYTCAHFAQFLENFQLCVSFLPPSFWRRYIIPSICSCRWQFHSELLRHHFVQFTIHNMTSVGVIFLKHD